MTQLPSIFSVLYRAFVKIVQNISSKKFNVYIVCTILLVMGYIPPELYLPVALAVLGVETALDWKGGRTQIFDVHPPTYEQANGNTGTIIEEP